MKQHESFPVAHLPKEKIQKIKEFETKLREETGEEIVLIAYESQKNEGQNLPIM
jgi:hypothetical protein